MKTNNSQKLVLALVVVFLVLSLQAILASSNNLAEARGYVTSPNGNSSSIIAIDYSLGDFDEDIKYAISNFVNENIDQIPTLYRNFIVTVQYTDELDVQHLVLYPTEVYESFWRIPYSESDVISLIARPADGKIWVIEFEKPTITNESLSGISAATLTYSFPWPNQQTWKKTQGFHYQNIGYSIDFAPISGASIKVLSIETGVLSTMCYNSDPYQVMLKVTHPNGDVSGYLHLDKNSVIAKSAPMFNKTISKGYFLGNLYTGSAKYNPPAACLNGTYKFATPCGCGTATHLHFESNHLITVQGTSLGTISSASNGTQYKSNNGALPPSSVTNVQASDGTFWEYIAISYTNVTDATKYEIWRNTTNDTASATKLADDDGSAYNDSAGLLGTTYYYWVRACNSSGCGVFSTPDTGYKASPPPIQTLTALSNASYDGHVMESTETSGVGGSTNSSTTALVVGDDVSNRQYRGIISFDTSGLPDNAVITSVTLRLKYSGVVGTNPFSTHGNLLADIRTGTFYSSIGLQKEDFQTSPSKSSVLSFTNSTIDGWYSAGFANINFGYINKTGVTQFRLRFAIDDNNDKGDDYLKIYSGDSGSPPELIIDYYVP